MDLSLLLLFSLLTVSECHRFMGCYKDFSRGGVRLMRYKEDFKGSLTPEGCVSHCEAHKFSYAGPQLAYECFCSDSRPSFREVALPQDCNYKCEGNKSKICGGWNRLSVYDLKGNKENVVGSNYIGCYADAGENERALRDKAYYESDDMTPEFCTGYCYSYGYRYSGVQAGKQCFCGDEIKGEKVNEIDCSQKCAGNSLFKCGGSLKSNIYHTSISDESEKGRLLGCYVDSNDRLLTGFVTDLPETNNPWKCLNMCLQLGFKYSGVQVGIQCFCGNKRPDPNRKAPESDCQKECPKGGEKVCGDIWRMNIYSTLPVIHASSGSQRFMGCYKDFNHGSRLMPYKTDFKATLTLEICINHCKSKGFSYSGAQFSSECFCSTERPPYIDTASPQDCNYKCDGDKSKMCGGSNRLSVYELEDNRINFVQTNYVGCYADFGETSRALTAKAYHEDAMTPEFCVGYCFSFGYRFSGVQSGKQCYCGDEIKGNKVNEGECNYECAGNSGFICGGIWRNSIYHTGISDESEEGRYLGCFEDSNDRLLPGFVTALKETNNPRRCMNLCLKLGFMFAGVQVGFECFCGDTKPDANRLAPEKDCQAPCPKGGAKVCGGIWRMNIYSTASINTTKPQTGPERHVAKPSGVGQPLTGSPRKSVLHATSPGKPCSLSSTAVGGKAACQGELIFHEKFESGIDRVWKHEVFMPEGPDYEFVVFDKMRENSFLQDGNLHIKPSIFNDEFVRTGSLLLNKCTGRRYSKECERVGKTYILLPPVRSARITTKDSFSFKYGKVVVRAKLPVGDWLLPEIWLEPKERVYGPEYQSGRIKIAHSLGNLYLSHQGTDIGSRRLQSGIAMGPESRIREKYLTRYHKANKGWHEDYHNYTLVWTPESISFQIDNEPVEDLISANSGSLPNLLGLHSSVARIWQHGSDLAPFDQEFYISIGVSVGGMREFPDYSITSEDHTKPWNNFAVKGLVDFWNDRINWYPTWKNNNDVLKIEDVLVYAL